MVLATIEHNAQEEEIDDPQVKQPEQESSILLEYKWKSEDATEDEMIKLLEESASNHFWTADEKVCLVHFHNICGGDYEMLQSEYFTHRSVGALKKKYKDLENGIDQTPASTPRLSISAASEIIKKSANKAINMCTPKKPEREMIPTEEDLNMEELEVQAFAPVSFSDDAEENEAVEDLSEIREEDLTELTEEEELQKQEIVLEPISSTIYLLVPLFLIMMVLAVTLVAPEEHLHEKMVQVKYNIIEAQEAIKDKMSVAWKEMATHLNKLF